MIPAAPAVLHANAVSHSRSLVDHSIKRGRADLGRERYNATGITHSANRAARACDEDDLPRCIQSVIRWLEGGVEVPVHAFGELEGFREGIYVD